MVDFLTLAKTDYTDLASKVDLIGGPLQLRRGSWIPKSGAAGQPVTETLDLVSTAGNAEIIAELGRIEALLHFARTWRSNPVQRYGTWLEWGIEGEPRSASEAGYAAKRAWVYGGELEILNVSGLPGPLMDQRIVARLAITRAPAFENLGPVYDSFTGYAWGDVADLSGWLGDMGTAPARIDELIVLCTGYGQEYWLGFRSENQGAAEFDPLWELELGVNGTDTTDAADATASGGNKITCSFATEDGLASRVTIYTAQAHSGVTSWNDFHGRYIVLCRCKVGASTEAGIRMKTGSLYDPDLAPAEEVFIDHTGWKLIELGQITIPAPGFRQEYASGGYTDLARYFMFELEAERLSGSGSLDLDCLYLIPAEHYIHGKTTDSGYSTTIRAFTTPDDQYQFQLDIGAAGAIYSAAEFDSRDWFLPVDLSFAVGAVQNVADHDMTKTLGVYVYWFPRWLLFRGS